MQLRILIVLVTAAACGGAGGDRKQSLSAAEPPGLPPDHPDVGMSSTLSPAARALLDSGNAAFRGKKFADAVVLYSRAARAAPDHAAPWFGVYMVAVETKQKALADSAMKEVQKRTPVPAPSAPSAPPAPAPDVATPFNPHAAPTRPARGS